MDASLEARWLVERSAAAGYIIIIVSPSLGSQGATWSYDFAYPPKPRGRRTLSVAGYSDRGGGEKGSWRKL